MGMGVKHFTFYGTKAEITDAKNMLHRRSTDRILYEKKIYQHMIDVLGIEIWELCVSKVDFSHTVYDSIKRILELHPTILYSATWKDGRLISNGLETFTNFAHEDIEYPGPFGALCKVYGHTYYNETPEETKKRVEDWYKSRGTQEYEYLMGDLLTEEQIEKE